MNQHNAMKALLIGGGLLMTASLGRAQTPNPMPMQTPTQDNATLPTPASTSPPTDTNGVQPTGKITKITVIGNKNISTDTILAAVTEKSGDVFDAAAAERDRAAITALGYWTGPAQIAATPDMNSGLDLTFSVTENPVVQAIVFNANTLTGQPTIPATTLLAQMQTQTGLVLNTNTLARDLDTLFNPTTGYAHRQGYRFLAGAAILEPTKGILTIPVIESYIQAILITGNRKVSSDDILNRLSIKPGDLYNDATAQQALTSLGGTDHLASVGSPTVVQSVPGRVVITVPVTESK